MPSTGCRDGVVTHAGVARWLTSDLRSAMDRVAVFVPDGPGTAHGEGKRP
jgi:hypothetical protein